MFGGLDTKTYTKTNDDPLTTTSCMVVCKQDLIKHDNDLSIQCFYARSIPN